MKCPYCQTDNPEGRNRCFACDYGLSTEPEAGSKEDSRGAPGSALWGTVLGDMSPARVLTHYKTLLIDTCEQDTSVRKLASEVLTDFEINGDSYGVPGIEDIVETLVRRVKAPNGLMSRAVSTEENE